MTAARPVQVDLPGWKKLPAKAPDGTPFCTQCRRYYGELHLTEPGLLATCMEYGQPVYTTRLTYEEAQAGAPCPGCGISYNDKVDIPAGGTMYYTDEERATAIAEEQRFREAHPRCHAGRWSVGGSRRLHCGRCCPPPPMGSEQRKSIGLLLYGGTRSRIDEARRVGKPAEKDPREMKLPGRATTLRQVLREYEQARAEVREKIPQDEWSILGWYGYPDPEELYRWRIQLDCGCVREVTTSGDDPAPLDNTWRHPWGERELPKGSVHHWHGDESSLGPYRSIKYWMCSKEYLKPPEPVEPPKPWRDMPDVWEQIRNKEVRKYARWTVRLDCGHLTTTLTEPDWKPGSEPKTDVERAEELRVEIETRGLFAGEGRDHWLRMIDLGLPQPEPEVRCPDCEGVHAIIGYERVGWLVPPPAQPKARKAKPRMPTREELLEQRIKELEIENARLKADQTDG